MKPLKTILSVVGTRPNYMKVGPLEEVFQKRPHLRHLLLHTGQHFDDNMSQEFFRDFNLRKPDIALGISGGSLGDQTGRLMIALEKAMVQAKPDLVVVVGDVNSTFAAAWVAVQNHLPVAHVEAGLRSFDRRMPEEINRLCTDVVADLLFTTHPVGSDQLLREGVAAHKIHMVGDIMIDYVVRYRAKAEGLQVWREFGLEPKNYGVVTLHRPSNVDQVETLEPMLDALMAISQELPLLFAVHPRTRKNLERFGLNKKLAATRSLKLCEPLGYLRFLSLLMKTKLALTDSGGIQEETTFLNIPCLTLRENTERGFCVDHGTNYLVGTKPPSILKTFQEIQSGKVKQAEPMPGWDGHTAERIADQLEALLYANAK